MQQNKEACFYCQVYLNSDMGIAVGIAKIGLQEMCIQKLFYREGWRKIS